MEYRREIDGLRAVAVVPVILFHAGIGTFGGGFVGVDVFFVISGYLITSIILRKKADDSFSILEFYERRARRILPALFFVMLAASPIAWQILLPPEAKEFAGSVLSATLFASNFFFFGQTGYFDTAGELKPLLHTWSLAVEEQYYLIFPILILIVWGSMRRVSIALTVILLVSFIYANYSVHASPDAAFYLLPTRMWELLIGALIAAYRFKYPLPAHPGNGVVLFRQMASLAGLALIVIAVFTFDRTTPTPSIHTLVPTAGAALVILFACPQTIAFKVLGNRLLVGLGLISYSAYLWHQPLFAFARQRSLHEPNLLVMLSLALLSLLLAYLTWRWIEAPFRSTARVSRRALLSASVAAAVMLGSFGAWGYASDGFEQLFLSRLSPQQRNTYYSMEYQTLVAPQNPKGRPAEQRKDRAPINKERYPDYSHTYGYCHLSFIPTKQFHERFDNCVRRHGNIVIIFGDSHAGNLYRSLVATQAYPFLVEVSRGGCRLHAPPVPECQHEAFESFLSENKDRVRRVIYTQAGFYLLQDAAGRSGRRGFFMRDDIPVYAPHIEYIRRVTETLQRLSRYGEIVWLGPRIEPHLNVSQLFRLSVRCALHQAQVPQNTVATFEKLDEELSRVVPALGKVRYESQIKRLRFEADQDLYDCGAVYWRDTDHWSRAGEARFGPRIVDLLH